MANPHFQHLSRKLLHLLVDKFLVDVEITTNSKPVFLHKIILVIFSVYNLEKFKAVRGVWKLDAQGYSSDIVENLVRLLYDGETGIGDKCTEIIRTLHLDLSVDQRIRRKKVSRSKGEHLENVVKLELKYLRDLTFEIGIPKLLQEPRPITDVQIRTGKDVHQCHKIILSAVSEYFAAMFSSGMKESNDDIVNLQGIKSDTFVSILNYIYTGRNIVTSTNAPDLLSNSVYLQMGRLQTLSEEYLLWHIDTSNCVDILKLAYLYNCLDLASGAITFIINNFSAINKLKLVRNLQFNDIVKIVTDDILNAPSEDEVLSFVLDWLATVPAEKCDAKSLLKHVRLELVERKYLRKVLNENKVVQTQPECVKLFQEALDIQMNSNVSAQSRKEETFVVLKRSSCFRGMEIACYSLSKKSWYKMQSFPESVGGTGFSACNSKTAVYVSGGSATPNSLYMFSVDENKWSELANMNEGRYAHATGYVQDKLYVLGGSSIATGTFDTVSSIEKYDITSNTWSKVGNMAIPTFDSAFAVVRTQVLIFGGSIASMSGVYIKDIQSFDTVTNTCTKLYHNLPFTLSLAVACVQNHDVYLTCPNGKIIHYNENTPPNVINQSKGSQLMGYATVYHNKAIYILGGYSMIYESDVIHRFSLKSMDQTVLRETKIPFQKQTNQLFATVMYVNRKYLNTDTEYQLEKDLTSPRKGYKTA